MPNCGSSSSNIHNTCKVHAQSLLDECPQSVIPKVRCFLQNKITRIHCHVFTLILLEHKVICLCHQYRARPACTFVQSDQALYCWLTNSIFLILLSLKMITDSSKNGRWIIPFKRNSAG